MDKAFQSDWYALRNEEGFDLEKPGIYEWRIEGVGAYVGKALTLRKRIRAYPNNVRRMLKGLHWHGDPTREYRPIHKALHAAHIAGTPVQISVLESCESSNRAAREQYWIKRRRSEAATGGLPVLNATG